MRNEGYGGIFVVCALKARISDVRRPSARTLLTLHAMSDGWLSKSTVAAMLNVIERPQMPARTKFLEISGYRVIRFWNNDVLNNTEGVMTTIREALTGAGSATAPHP